MKSKRPNSVNLMFIFAGHGPKAFHYCRSTASKIQSAIRKAKLDGTKILIVHEGAYYPSFSQEKLDEETFEEYFKEFDRKQIEKDLQDRYVKDLRMVESKMLFQKGGYPRCYMESNVSHTIEMINFDAWLSGIEAEFYEQKKLNSIYSEDILKSIEYIELSGKALAKETKGRDGALIEQLERIAKSTEVNSIIVPRGSIHCYISDICKSHHIFLNIDTYSQSWNPSPMNRWIMALILGNPPLEMVRIAAIKELACILEANRLLVDSAMKKLGAIEKAVATVDSIPRDKLNGIISTSQRITLSEFEEILGLSNL